MPTPDFVGDPADDFSLYEKISGPTIDQLIRQPTMHNFNGSDWYLRTVSEHLQMWKDTLSTNSPACSGSYIGKTNKTTDLALSLSIWSAFLSDVAAKPIVVNKVQLPPLNEMLYAMGRLVGQCKTTVLSHGDEGLCNSILDSAGSRIAYVDVGEAGRRIIGEPIAKLLLWFAATMSEKVKFEYQIIDGVPTIDYQVKLPKEVHEIILKARDIIFSEIGDSIDMPSLYACCMMYLLREIQWISRRQRDIMLAPLFAMAMEAAGAMLGILDELPVFTKSQKTLTTFMV
ncbi:hypothetical protein KKF61_06760 [Patescibacteria group bacterium]|nr:hypothetical protein [Patescibacteria group bacterium]